jgi:hypothetical protein
MKQYIVDLFSKTYYGSYLDDEKEQLKSDIELVKEIADVLLEVGTNVIVVDENTLKKDYLKFRHGSTYDVKKKIKEIQNKIMEKQNDKI